MTGRRPTKRKNLGLSLYASKRRRKNYNKVGVPSAVDIPSSQGNITYCHYTADSSDHEIIDVGTEQEAFNKSPDKSTKESKTFSLSVANTVASCITENANPPSSTEPNVNDTNSASLNQPMDNYDAHCLQVLTDAQKVSDLIQHCKDAGMLQHFMDFFNHIASGTLSPLELPVLLALERAKFESLTTTTQMKFHPNTKKFFALGYNMFGNSFLEFCSGPKSHGQIISGVSRRGLYQPSEAKVNFVVPNKKHLHSHMEQYEPTIPPSVIPQSLQLVRNKKDMILQIDGKKIARGLRPLVCIDGTVPQSSFVGDEDCWGFEHPSIAQVREKLDAELESIQVAKHNFTDSEHGRKLNMLEGHIKLLSNRIHDIRLQQLKVKKSLQYNEKKNKQPGGLKRYQYAISSCKTYLYSMYLWTQKTLNHIQKFLECAAMIQGSRQLLQFDSPCDMAERTNARILHHPDILQYSCKTQLESVHVKQKTPLWHKLRHLAVVTGSSAYSALGFRSGEDMKAHFREFVFHTGKRHFSDQQLFNMRYGSDNEIHAQATLCSVVMPALLPACATFVEMGAVLFDGDNRQCFLEISPDGVIVFDHNEMQSCCNSTILSDRENLAVEIKCMVPGPYKVPVAYQCPREYVFQILLEMFATESHMLWLCFYCKQSMTVIECDFHDSLCQDLIITLKATFDKEHITKPSSAKVIVEEFAPRIDEYIQYYTRFLGEFPVVSGEIGALHLCSSPYNPYHVPEGLRTYSVPSNLYINNATMNLWDASKQILLECADLLRNEATEMLAFVLSNAMRLHREDEVPYVPIAYALKGYSMQTDTLRAMWEHVLQECHQNGCNVLCTVVDGQHLNLATKTSEGIPLTRLQLMKSLWSQTCKLSKAELIRVIECCDMAPHYYPRKWVVTPDKPYIWIKHHEQQQRRTSNNKQPKGASELAQPLDDQQINSLLAGRDPVQPHASSSNSAYPTLVDYDIHTDSDDDESYTCNSSLSSLAETLQSSSLSIFNASIDSDPSSADHHYHPAMSHILTSLKERGRSVRWHSVTVTQLVRDKLATPAQIRKLFLYELDIIRDSLKSSFGKAIYKGKTDANIKYQKVTEVFCPGQAVSGFTPATSLRIHLSSVMKLKSLSKKILLSAEYPKSLLQIAVCKIQHREKVKAWENASSIPLHTQVPGTDFTHELYCYPQWNEQLNALQFITFDPNHCLTNLRAQICRKGFAGVRKQAFIDVTEEDNSVLPNSVVVDVLDKQNVQLAERFFSEDVQRILYKLGHFTEANFCQITRQWFQSCDKRGIPQSCRFKHLQEMFNFLDSKIDYSDYPPPSQYIQGIPIKTFECIMHGISTKFALLSQSSKGTFSARQITTLCVENWFSEITRREFSGLGCPKSCDIPRLIGRMVELNTAQQDAHRGFHLNTKKKNVYPYHLLEGSLSDAEVSNGVRQINSAGSWFDKPPARPNAGKKTKSISGFREITRGSQPVREYFRIDEGKIPAHKRSRHAVRYDTIADMI